MGAFFCLLAVAACGWFAPKPAEPGIGAGAWRLDAEGARGALILDSDGCRIGLWGERWSTGADDLVACALESAAEEAPEPGDWIYFPFVSGLGEGQAAARLDPDAPRLVLPLSARRGEAVLEITRAPGVASAAEIAAWAAASREALVVESAIWSRGALRLMDGAQLVGEILFSDGRVYVSVFDASWMSDGAVEAQWWQEGTILVLQFPVMPALRGEEGMIRVDTLARVARVPLGDPSAGRALQVLPGEADTDAVAAAYVAAEEAAIARERSLIPRLARELAGAARQGEACLALDAIEGEWGLWFAGYEVAIQPAGAGCEVVLEPEPVQHGRRLALRVGPDGLEETVRPLR